MNALIILILGMNVAQAKFEIRDGVKEGTYTLAAINDNGELKRVKGLNQSLVMTQKKVVLKRTAGACTHNIEFNLALVDESRNNSDAYTGIPPALNGCDCTLQYSVGANSSQDEVKAVSCSDYEKGEWTAKMKDGRLTIERPEAGQVVVEEYRK